MIEYEAKKKGIDLQFKYGMDGQYIKFTPKCSSNIIKGDVIVQDNISLYCVEPDTFVIYDRKIDFVLGTFLLKEFNKLIA